MDYSFGFIAKKLISGMLQPLPLLLLFMAIGLLLVWLTRFQKTGKSLLTFSWISLFLISLQPVADSLLLPIETQYTTFDANTIKLKHPEIKYIVVLGGGHAYHPNWAPSSNILNNSLPRIIEGIRIHKEIPGSKLIFTGGPALNSRTAAQSAEAVALSIGVQPEEIIRSDTPKDTAQEARAVKDIVGKDSFILVTSANHLPRAVKAFELEGLSPIPAPANQLAMTNNMPFWEKWFPSALYLSHFERVWSELMGQGWQALMHQKNIEQSP
ncbi:envelope biogenesis factor ElyC [Thorsellia anophelis]|uniref:Uncharacterized SAM-binding protein YcdF, DUF218 family n=1 Tax=Thorsellia anophelis DSM 18579 TaxID=1123402 RepID=A0A1I0B2Y7_9GAMM|nr:envelope biogenesis factor ElyC [Thorsellia anophelis]SET01086.1 Uncharacterized SAM-binding protein YcdF, DUF218 family [Thorsellia anophelis DSM 18579]